MTNQICVWKEELNSLKVQNKNLGNKISVLHDTLSVFTKKQVNSWAERIKNSSSLDDLKKKISQFEKYKESIVLEIAKLEEQINEEKLFQDFLQPFKDAEFIIYDDGECAYLAQTLQNIKPLNKFLLGGCFVHPDIFRKFNRILKSHGLSIRDKLPGDYSKLTPKYVEMANSFVMDDLRHLYEKGGKTCKYSIHFNERRIYL
jgi:hypothetical protein